MIILYATIGLAYMLGMSVLCAFMLTGDPSVWDTSYKRKMHFMIATAGISVPISIIYSSCKYWLTRNSEE